MSDLLFRIFVAQQGRLTFVSLIYIIIFFILNYYYKDFRKFAKSTPLKIWIVLTLYHLVNASLKNVPAINFVDYLMGFKVYASICIFSFLFYTNLKATCKYIYYNYIVWLTIAFLITFVSFGQRLTGDVVIAIEIGRNAMLMAVAAIFYCISVGVKLKGLVLRLIFPAFFILISQTRTSFGILLIILIGYYYSYILKGRLNFNKIVGTIIIIFISMLSYDYLIENTGLGDRLQENVENIESSTYRKKIKTGTYFDYIAGDRIYYYVKGWELFQAHYYTGIGLDNFKDYTHGNYPMHVEYMTHLAEGGIIAFTLWMLFILILFRYILKFRINKRLRTLLLFMMLAIIFACGYTVMYENELYVILYAIILSFIIIQHPNKTYRTHLSFIQK